MATGLHMAPIPMHIWAALAKFSGLLFKRKQGKKGGGKKKRGGFGKVSRNGWIGSYSIIYMCEILKELIKIPNGVFSQRAGL